MANIFKNFINSLHLNDDDEDDDDEYEEYVSQTAAREQRRAERTERLERKAEQSPRSSRYTVDEEAEPDIRSNTTSMSDLRKERATKAEKAPAKVVPIRGGAGSAMGIRVMKPTSFEDSQDICDVLLSGRATIINLEGFDLELAQRVMDFISGAVYAANGKLHQISNYIFIISPDGVDISGDYLDMIKQNGFEVPTINRD